MRRALSILLVLLATASTACSGGRMEWLDAESAAGPTWPEPPAEPRISYLGSIDDAGAVGMGGGVFRRVAEAVLGRRPRRLVRPSGVVAIGDGAWVVVADPGIPAIHIIRPDKASWRVLRGSREIPLLSPVGLAVEGEEVVWVTDSGTARVLRLDLASERLEVIAGPDLFEQPVGIAVVDEDRLVVVDTARHRLVWLTKAGELIGYEGRRGTGPGEFNFPTMVAVGMDGDLIVADTLNFRIQFRTPEGSWERSLGAAGDGTGYLARPKGLSVDSRGTLYVAEGYYSNLSIFDYASGAFNLVIGRVGTAPGEFRLPVGLFVDGENRLFVADSQNARVQVFRYVGLD